MSIEIGLALKFLRAWIIAHHRSAWVGIFAFGIVRLEVRLPVVAPLEELAAHTTFVGSFLGRGPLSLLLNARYAGKDGLHIKPRKATVGGSVQFGDIASGIILGPFRGLCSVQIFSLRGEGVWARGVGERSLGR